MKHILVATFITLLALGTGCAWISPASETASDGINVHGHWTVTVTNPDGTVDAVHEFDNALSQWGANTIRDLILGEVSIIGYGITLFHDNASALDFDCEEDQRPDASPNYEELVATATKNPEDFHSPLTISATCTISSTQDTSAISNVRTYLHKNDDKGHAWNPFAVLTTKNFKPSTPLLPDKSIPVGFGQIISFNVVISFN